MLVMIIVAVVVLLLLLLVVVVSAQSLARMEAKQPPPRRRAARHARLHSEECWLRSAGRTTAADRTVCAFLRECGRNDMDERGSAVHVNALHSWCLVGVGTHVRRVVINTFS